MEYVIDSNLVACIMEEVQRKTCGSPYGTCKPIFPSHFFGGEKMRFTMMKACLGMLLLGAMVTPSLTLAGDYTDAITASNPLSYWRFDDASTGYLQTAADEQGNNPGTYNFGVSQVAGAPINDATNLAGYFDMGYVDVGTLPGFGASMASGITVEMWVQSTQTNEGGGGGGGIVFGLGGATTHQFFINLDEQPNGAANDDYIRVFGRSDDRQTYGGANSDTNITDGNWHYMAVTYTGEVGNGDISVYIASPGEETTTNYGGTILANAMTTSGDFLIPAIIGAINHLDNGAQQFYAGTLDEFAIYDRALSQYELDNHFRAADPNLDPLDPPVIYDDLLSYDGGTVEVPTMSPLFEAEGLSGSDMTGTNYTTRSDREFQTASGNPVFDLAMLDQTDVVGAIADGDYFEFSITPDAGKTLDLATLEFNFAKGGDSGEREFFIQTNTGDGGAFEEFVGPTTSTAIQPSFAKMSFDLSDPKFDVIDDTLTFRIYGYAGSDARTLMFDDFLITGFVNEGGTEPIAGDANNDGKVDGSDVTILAGNWQKGVSDGLTADWEEGDFNGDGKVDGSDVTILAGNWQYGVTAAAASVPEPSMIVLLLGALASLMVVRRGR